MSQNDSTENHNKNLFVFFVNKLKTSHFSCKLENIKGELSGNFTK